MPVNVIGTLKPKNNGKFPVAEAVDIKVTDNLRLDEALENKADLSTVNFALGGKADNSDIDNLQAQINEIITPVTQDAEVQNARVGADGTTYTTLKERIDTEENSLKESLNETNSLISTGMSNVNIIWEDGAYSDSTGEPASSDKYIRSKNYIAGDNSILTFTHTYAETLALRIYEFDLQGGYIPPVELRNTNFERIKLSADKQYKISIATSEAIDKASVISAISFQKSFDIYKNPSIQNRLDDIYDQTKIRYPIKVSERGDYYINEIKLFSNHKYMIRNSEAGSAIAYNANNTRVFDITGNTTIFITPESNTSIYRIYANNSVDISILDLSSYYMEEEKKLYVTPEMFGAYGDGVHDDTNAFSEAIEYINDNVGILLIEKGTYKITSDLPELVPGTSIMGKYEASSSNCHAIIWDYRTTGNFLFSHTQERAANEVNGGVISNLLIQNFGNQANKCFRFLRCSWTGLMKNVYIYKYNVGVWSETNDFIYENVHFIDCGMYSGYAIELRETDDGAGHIRKANYQRFVNCHIENTYHCIRIYGTCFNNTFENLHCEMIAPDLSYIVDDQPPIVLSSYKGRTYRTLFIGCDFTALDRRYYTQKLSAAPPFISGLGTTPTQFIGCSFVCGNISTALGDYHDRLYLADGRNMFFENCKIDGLDLEDIGVNLNNSIFRNNILKYFVNNQSTETGIILGTATRKSGNAYIFNDEMVFDET